MAGMTYPELRHLEVEGANDVYPQDVEAEANDWFQKVYHEQLNIDDFVAMLKGWQVCCSALITRLKLLVRYTAFACCLLAAKCTC